MIDSPVLHNFPYLINTNFGIDILQIKRHYSLRIIRKSREGYWVILDARNKKSVLLAYILSIYRISAGTDTILHTESWLGKKSRKYQKNSRNIEKYLYFGEISNVQVTRNWA